MGAMDPASTVVGFVGTGVMGASMARHVMRAGYAVRVYNRSRAKAEPLLAEGATWDDTAGSLAASSSVVITMVGYPADVEAVYFDPGGILASAKPGTYLVDMTTSSPELASRIA
ncbi:MAG TPA: NAD(P)-binding domain-containing protein, partial [Synergistaceae bacterium]|nr:NAD(P)-binding domain-containing protein [Synergistaceae bacterium]